MTDYDLMTESKSYKPFRYPWCYSSWERQQQSHWLPEEVPLGDDVRDWKKKLTDSEKNLLTHIFRFFTQADIEVNDCYMEKYAGIFKPVEVKMMLAAFSNIETIHIAAYSYLLDTIGMPETEYSAFLDYKEMSDKHENLKKFNMNSKKDIAMTLAVFGAFTEGVQLFASFAILLNFQRFNKMKGMGQIVTWSARDETLHCYSIIKLFRTFVSENKEEIWDREFICEIYEECINIIRLEDNFIDLAFEMGDMEGLTALEVKKYIRYIADRRLEQLGLCAIFGEDYDGDDDCDAFMLALTDKQATFTQKIQHNGKNPLPWMDELFAIEHANFFEQRATEYSKSATQGTWDDAFKIFDIKNDEDK